MNKKENSKSLVKKMLLSISIMSCFAAVGVDNVSAMRSIFGDVSGKSDNGQQNTTPGAAPVSATPTKQLNSSYRIAVPVAGSDLPILDKNIKVDSKILVDTKEKSGNDSDFFANGENPIPLILRHYGTENLKNKQFSLCKTTLEKLSPNIVCMFDKIPADISEYLNRHFMKSCYSQISNVVMYIDRIKNISDVKNNIADMHDEVSSCLDSYLLPSLKECFPKHFKFFSDVRDLLFCFLNVLEWEAIDRHLFNNVTDLGEMCLKASYLTGQSDASHLLWCISLLCDNEIVKQDILSENVDMSDDDLIVGKKIRSLKLIREIINNLNDESDNKLKAYLSLAYNVFYTGMFL